MMMKLLPPPEEPETQWTSDEQGVATTTVFLGEVLRFHIHEGVAGKSPSGKVTVDADKLKPVSRLGGNTCALLLGCLSSHCADNGLCCVICVLHVCVVDSSTGTKLLRLATQLAQFLLMKHCLT